MSIGTEKKLLYFVLGSSVKLVAGNTIYHKP